jgi:dTDP-4-amino-4,6-dideoxygalactose transaminase
MNIKAQETQAKSKDNNNGRTRSQSISYTLPTSSELLNFSQPPTTKTITLNKVFCGGKELNYMAESITQGKIAGNGMFTRKCHHFFEDKYNVGKALLTTSCTDALEMCALLLEIKHGDEVICPSYTFVSTANAFALRGAKLVFADSESDRPNIDAELIESLITLRTKAIVVVHYAGIACDMDRILEIASNHNIPVVEDAAQAIDSFYKGRPLGTIGQLGTFSFHETKNIVCGEGGLLAINDLSHVVRAEIIRDKGTNMASFLRGEVNKYSWVDIGSSFLPSDIVAAYLYAQLEQLEKIQSRRREIWDRYFQNLADILPVMGIHLPIIPDWASNNAHAFYLVCHTASQRTAFIRALDKLGIQAAFHYPSLHNSPYFWKNHDGRQLPNSDRFANCLVRLPLYYELTNAEVDFICEQTIKYFSQEIAF